MPHRIDCELVVLFRGVPILSESQAMLEHSIVDCSSVLAVCHYVKQIVLSYAALEPCTCI